MLRFTEPRSGGGLWKGAGEVFSNALYPHSYEPIWEFTDYGDSSGGREVGSTLSSCLKRSSG